MGPESYHHVKSSLHFLTRDPIYQSEKPYLVDKEVDLSNVPRAVETNRILEECPVKVHDVRACLMQEVDIDVTGWTFVKGEAEMSTADFHDPPTMESTYFDELLQMMKDQFPQYSSLALLDHVVRPQKKSQVSTRGWGCYRSGATFITYTHSDFSTKGAERRGEIYVKENPTLEGIPFDMLNIWRLIRKGPNNDWSLGLCDYRTVDIENDLIDNDIVFYQGTTENTVLHFNPSHQWYWKPNMDMDDVIVFRNASSEGRDAPRAFHGSFEVPDGGGLEQGGLRESIESRIVAFSERSGS
ncbi:hypothetical protein DL98DRAFT_600828 [Cadophora sp. DSE1049]|nr:hypothetical protein DL98DRAFT_600828 [Cadophora sp. DSE1049]